MLQLGFRKRVRSITAGARSFLLLGRMEDPEVQGMALVKIINLRLTYWAE